MRRQTRYEKESVAGVRAKGFARSLQGYRQNIIGAQRHSRRVAFLDIGRYRRALQRVDVPEDAVQLGNESGQTGVVDRQARELRRMQYIMVGDRHLLPPAFKFGLRQHQRFPSNLLVFKIDAHFEITPAAGEFGDGT